MTLEHGHSMRCPYGLNTGRVTIIGETRSLRPVALRMGPPVSAQPSVAIPQVTRYLSPAGVFQMCRPGLSAYND